MRGSSPRMTQRERLKLFRLDLDDEIVALPQPRDRVLADLGADPRHNTPDGVDVHHRPIGIGTRRLAHSDGADGIAGGTIAELVEAG